MMMKIRHKNNNITNKELDRLKYKLNGEFFNLLADLILLSYSKKELQSLLIKSTANKGSFIEKSSRLFPFDLSEELFYAYQDINRLKWEYFAFSVDKASGYEAIAYTQNKILAVGISGTDGSYEDVMDNDTRLLVPKGVLIPTQFNVVKRKLLGLINKYKFKYGHYPKEVVLVGNSLGGAVATVGYTQLYPYLSILGIKIKAFTHNSAPLRYEYIEEILNKAVKIYKLEWDSSFEKVFYKNILNIINEDDMLNNIMIKIIDRMDNFGHVGKYAIIKGENNLQEQKILHYALEHINVRPIRNISLSVHKNIEYYSKRMLESSKEIIKNDIDSYIEDKIVIVKEYSRLSDRIKGSLAGGMVLEQHFTKSTAIGDASYSVMAVAKGIVENPEDPIKSIGKNLIEWHALYAKNIGKTTEAAIKNALIKGDFFTGAKIAHQELKEKSAGNASLKRTAPIALAYSKLQDVIDLSGIQSNMTHFDGKAKEACQLYSWLIYELLTGTDKEKILADLFASHLYYGQYRKLESLKTIDDPCYVVEALLGAITIFYHSDSFEEAIRLLNMLDDPSELASLTGTLLGVCYGYGKIPKKMLFKVDFKEKMKMYKISSELLKVRRSEN